MEALGIDLKLLIAQIVNFVIFYLIFKRFVARPLLSYLKKQQDEEITRTKLTADLQSAHAAMEADKSRMLQEMSAKQRELMDQAKQAADKVRADMTTQAQKQSEDIVAAGRQAVEAERQKVESQLSSHVKQMAKLAVEKGLADYLTPEAQAQVTERIVNAK